MYPSEDPVPADPVPKGLAAVGAHPGKQGLAYNMVFGDKAPVARIFGVMAVIAHHPVIIHFKGVGIGFFTVDKNIMPN